MDDDLIEVVRRFNRSFTPRIGVLDESFHGTGLPLAAARLLFDIGLEARTVQQLRTRLDLDSGYLSRLLRQLEGDGLVHMTGDLSDRRRRVVALTDTGAVLWAQLDERSDTLVRDMVSSLTPQQRSELSTALATADRLFRLGSIELCVVDPASDEATGAMTAYFAELNQRFPTGFVADDSEDDLDAMRHPNGAFVIVTDGTSTLGCGGLRRLDDERAEVKRMWIDSSMRGCGMGRRLLADLESRAIELGCTVVVLDTNATLDAAIAMYASAGYESIERYNDNPYAQRWFRKALR